MEEVEREQEACTLELLYTAQEEDFALEEEVAVFLVVDH